MIAAPSYLLDDSDVNVLLVGCGGTGSYVATQLAQIDYNFRKLSGRGLSVTVYDPDTVSPHNVGRQNFWPIDIGFNKSEAMVDRINTQFGFSWKAVPEAFDFDDAWHNKVVLTCLDKASVRYELGKHYEQRETDSLWIDGGNGQHDGQIIMGHLGNPRNQSKIPNLFDLYGELLVATPDDDTESCSHEQSLSKQDYGVNHTTAMLMCQLLWQLLRHGKTDAQGGYFDLREFEVSPLLPTEQVWRSFGYQAGQ